MKEELLEDVPTRVKLRDWRRGCEVIAVSAVSESSDSEEFEDLGGEGSSVGIGTATRS